MKEAHQLIEQVTLGKDPRHVLREADDFENVQIDGVDLTALYDMLEGDSSDQLGKIQDAFKKQSEQLSKIHSVKNSHLTGLQGTVKQITTLLQQVDHELDKGARYLDQYYRTLNKMD